VAYVPSGLSHPTQEEEEEEEEEKKKKKKKRKKISQTSTQKATQKIAQFSHRCENLTPSQNIVTPQSLRWGTSSLTFFKEYRVHWYI
jgi:CRISPR/Cas system CSM-associated protein Csm4 (group 5 of RAMP superfamily)